MKAKRFYRVSDVLVAEVLTSGKVRWWELDRVPFDNLERGLGGIRAKPQGSFFPLARMKPRYGWDEDDPGFENAVRTVEGE